MLSESFYIVCFSLIYDLSQVRWVDFRPDQLPDRSAVAELCLATEKGDKFTIFLLFIHSLATFGFAHSCSAQDVCPKQT